MDSYLFDEARFLLQEKLCTSSEFTTPSKVFEDSVVYLLQLLRRMIDYGESNSLLVIGPQGSGKSSLVLQTLAALGKDHASAKDLMEVHLNGLMQTDDRITVEEITRQLKLENAVGDRVFGSISENLAFLLNKLRVGNSANSCPLIFVLEEFDLFAQHKNQTFLYNLFDIIQAGTTPMAVIGLTCRLDVMDLFEKRVKSRFSHRQIYLTNVWCFEEYLQAFKMFLTLPKSFSKRSSGKQSFCKLWNNYVDELLKSPSVLKSLQMQFDVCKEISPLCKLLALPLAHFNPLRDVSEYTGMIVKAVTSAHADSKSQMLHGLSVLQICLVVSMHHVSNTYNVEFFTFQMIYNEYIKFAKHRSSIFQNYNKTVVMKAFEQLIELELVIPCDGNISSGNSKLPKEYKLLSLLVEQRQLHDALHKYHGFPSDVKQWVMSSLE